MLRAFKSPTPGPSTPQSPILRDTSAAASPAMSLLDEKEKEIEETLKKLWEATGVSNKETQREDIPELPATEVDGSIEPPKKKKFIERTEVNAIIKTIVIAIESDEDVPLVNLEFNQIRSGIRYKAGYGSHLVG